MKRVVSLFLAAVLILQFSSLKASASGPKESYREQLIKQHMAVKKNLFHSLSTKTHLPTNQLSKLSNINKSDTDYFYEVEPNDTTGLADDLPFETMAIGQFLTYEDVDFYKVNVPSNGSLYVTGVIDEDSSMILAHGLFTVDGDSLNYVEPTDYYYDGAVLIYSYDLSKGDYFVAAIEYDGDVYSDYYGIVASFESYDNTPPAKPVINAIDDNDTVITGKAEAKSKVSVYRSSTYVSSGTADSNGKFSIKLPMQKAGTTLSVYAKDESGNKSATATTKVLDKTPPSAPTVNPVDDNDTTIKGKTEANATISVKKGTSVIGTAKANSKGDFSVTIKAVAAKTSLTVTSKDTAGNTSKVTTITVIDKTPPKVISISPVDNNDQYVKGKTEANATATVKNGTKEANSKGEFSVKIAVQKTNTVLSVYAKDANGNTSKASTVTVTKAK
ncbi:Ig-like domain-containing protein [Fictibacillus barbaricus]|uniref:Bacterial Ig domain-containing protein n=1 Tax=Fictibacillus barbaricus TaxID=182136 RepID=A0ABU1U1J4_9BACL|nr:Ig-like domain-containing protein [Fictibacillus barbaricus]MDR7073334.1 hypothetical protein [Fictibacillus barbaricus]